ncbi:MAG: hypothetical protein E2O73_00190, partial [Deltaproteobacteria bacterium]
MHAIRLSHSCAIALAGLLLALVALPHGSAQAQLGQDDQNCINELNKNFAKVAKAQAKDICQCLKNGSKGKLSGETIEECTTSDSKGKVAKAKSKALAKAASKCTVRPPFGPTAAEGANQVAMSKELDLIHEIFGSDLDTAIILQSNDKDSGKCQLDVAKATKKCQETKLKAFNQCKKNGLKDQSIQSFVDLQACMGQDPKGKIAKACVEKLSGRIAKCDSSVDLSDAFPGCGTDDPGELGSCLDALVECAVCRALNQVDNLARDCDSFDDGVVNGSCGPLPVEQETLNLPSSAQPAETPGTPGVVVDPNSPLITQFGDPNFDLNNARYTRYFLGTLLEPPPAAQPDAILILIPGFQGGAGSFKILAENLIRRAFLQSGLTLEVWAFDRRSKQLEDAVGLDIAEAVLDPNIALDWLYGAELGLSLHPALVSGPNRRAIFHNTSDDIPFLASWTELVFSRDIDAVVEEARATATNANVFLGGHSAGASFTGRYAATNFNPDPEGAVEAGYAKLRGLVLLEGSGGSTAGAAPAEDTLDRIEDRFDGGLFNAVKSDQPSCVDGTLCDPNNPVACSGKGKQTCTGPRLAYDLRDGLLNPRVIAAVEPLSIQAVTDPDSGQIILQVDQNGIPGNNAIDQVPDLFGLSLILPDSYTVEAGFGSFIDDDGFIFGLDASLPISLGFTGPTVNGLVTWLDITEVVPPEAFPDNGPAPTGAPFGFWGVEKEPTRIDRVLSAFYVGETNVLEWYYPSSGLSVTSGLPSLDSSALSLDPPAGRGRRDIENLTQAANIDIPVISFGGSNGFASVPGTFVAFGQSIGTCTAASCDGFTPRVVDPNAPNAAFPTLGGVAGGYEVHISEGFTHQDIIMSEDNADNNVIAPLLDFL